MSSAIVTSYVNLLAAGRRELSQVPAALRDAVREEYVRRYGKEPA